MELPVGGQRDLRDEVVERPVVSSEAAFHGMVWDVRRDTVHLDAAGEVTREYVEHPGAVVVLALRVIDDIEHVVLIRQYRHPVRTVEWELPAGLLDVADEPPWETAARELLEEADLVAGRWDVLIDFFASPGGMSEALRVYLAREVEVSEGEDFSRAGEEAEIRGLWVPLDEAYAAVLGGQLHNPGAVVGIMAAWGARERGWSTLRERDVPWPFHPAYGDAGEGDARPGGADNG